MEVVDSKYGSAWGGCCSSEPIGVYRVGLWKNIRSWGKFCSREMDPRFDSGLIFGVWIRSLKKPF
jgi:hypothetical protein